MKRTISIILSVMMILSSFVGVSAFAVTTETCSIEYVSSNNVTISNTDKTVKKCDSYVATIKSDDGGSGCLSTKNNRRII